MTENKNDLVKYPNPDPVLMEKPSLKKYIKNGTEVCGEECPNCKNKKLTREDGCIACKQCGYSKCS